ncbi:MAG TPA: bifunctional glutamate N-acetyltransferase/amino-acid acetyltransferase ArgJ [Microthrixaceae bacterium]|nr:bifunctional glutamate N-acetyltransferase/amino-acid acetyltransferase ArgJ [Microthrixaceae bacterium]HMT23481.1 bifunctional glutamate N-acetyltransferase/amino-acid acetyltransferase ArgJ [Microthrixaceae bacterium]HMT62586.1 bifunctional glutamate N-acetyltransferase/amino-acid acetyltransferase ArgJ [Microthrixaceae bacterium]
MNDPQGYSTITANLGVKDDTTDFCVVVSDRPTAVAGVFTRSRFAGPSVTLSRSVVADGMARGVVVISKNANVANGAVGAADAAELQSLAAGLVGVDATEMVVASTGVIGRVYPMERIRDGITGLAPDTGLAPNTAGGGCDFDAVARAIMTTDTHPKIERAVVGDATIVGVAKGVGMIEPDMATLLTFFFTDAAIEPPTLDALFRRVVDRTFNALSIDTDTSTSDSAVVFANGAAGTVDLTAFEEALGEIALALVLQIAADGEGATRVIEATVTGARDGAQAKRVAKAIVNSPLVKTAVHGADPNWGRVVMAIGKCHDDTDIDPDAVRVWIGDDEMYPTLATPEVLDRASAHMLGTRVLIRADLGIGDAAFTAYGCDLTDGYVRINADYTT